MFETGTEKQEKLGPIFNQLGIAARHDCFAACLTGEIRMNVDLIFKIAAIGILVSVLNQVLIGPDGKSRR
jgi:hypothetical protein